MISGGKKSPDSAADAAISIPRLILRLFVICAVCVILALPLLTISVWLLLVALLCDSCLSVLPAAYLSGDNGFSLRFRIQSITSAATILLNGVPCV